jgi:hypothetical protein
MRRCLIFAPGSELLKPPTSYELIKRVITNNVGEGNCKGDVLSNKTSMSWCWKLIKSHGTYLLR